MFNPGEPKFAKGVECELPYPTDDSPYITRAAIAGLGLVYLKLFFESRGSAGALMQRSIGNCLPSGSPRRMPWLRK